MITERLDEMIKMIKQYNAYTSKRIISAAYILYPCVILAVSFALTFIFRNSESCVFILSFVSMFSMIYSVIVICVSDRYCIGTIMVNNSQLNEMAKTSSTGKTVILNIIKWDIFQRLILIGVIYLGLFISRAIISDKNLLPLILMSILGIVSSHMVSSLLCWICRKIENNTISTLIYSFGFIWILPTIILSVFPFEKIPPVIIIVTAAVYLTADVIINVIGVILMKNFINKEWYNDRISEGR